MRIIKHGSADKSVGLYILDSTLGTPESGVVFNTSGMALTYRREGAVAVDCTPTSNLALLTTAHTDLGILEVGNGFYRFDAPDAAFSAGADTVSFQGTVTGMMILPVTIQLDAKVVSDVATDVLASVVESNSSITLSDAAKYILAATVGVTAGDGLTIKDPSGTTTRIAATISGSNRTAMSLDP